MTNIKAPYLTPNGNYDPSSLKAFLRDCHDQSVKPHEIASILRVSIDRVEYLMGDGYRLIMRQRTPLATNA